MFDDVDPEQEREKQSDKDLNYADHCGEYYTDFLLDSIIEEYMLLGYSDSMILHMFRSPWYKSANSIYLLKGEEYILMRIQKIRRELDGKIL